MTSWYIYLHSFPNLAAHQRETMLPEKHHRATVPVSQSSESATFGRASPVREALTTRFNKVFTSRSLQINKDNKPTNEFNHQAYRTTQCAPHAYMIHFETRSDSRPLAALHAHIERTVSPRRTIHTMQRIPNNERLAAQEPFVQNRNAN